MCSSDLGRGIPVDKHKKTGKSTLETVLTVLHAGGKFGGGGYKVSGGLHGVGASVVNALSEYMEVEIKRNGKIYSQKYSRGKTLTPLTETGESRKTGSKTVLVSCWIVLIQSYFSYRICFFYESFRLIIFIISDGTVLVSFSFYPSHSIICIRFFF